MIKGYFITIVLLFSFSVIAADIVPYSVKSIKPVGAGYIELVAPGKMNVIGETISYLVPAYEIVSPFTFIFPGATSSM